MEDKRFKHHYLFSISKVALEVRSSKIGQSKEKRTDGTLTGSGDARVPTQAR